MKPDNQKSQIKTIKKNIREDIKLSLINGLKAVAGKFNSDTANIEKEINKSAKLLAKKFVKGMMNEQISAPQPVEKIEQPAPKAKAVKKETAQPAAKKKQPVETAK
jgi:hypothetical protein